VALGRFTSAVRARFGERVRELTLFGSHARGEAHDESDVDVLVVIDGLTESERRDVMGLAYDADAADRQAWVGLAPLPYATTQADELRAREKRLLLDIGREGIAL
jgi:predicted nucleotidyltransferase